jgi:D-arabinose 5-phosphate isomerase GutQ
MRLKYIENIWRNVSEVDDDRLEDLYRVLNEYDCIIPYGSGRSYSALKIPMSQYSKIMDKTTVLTPEDTGFPGNTMYEALDILVRRYKKILLLVNSGSGVSEEPLTIAKDFAKFVDDHGNENLKLVAITSKPDSPIGSLASKYGFVIELKGRRDERVADFLTTGIMGDSFELGSMMLIQSLVKSIYLGGSEYIRTVLEEYYENIIKYFDEYVEADTYNEIIDVLSRRNNVFVGGRGSAHEVATMLVIRLNHIKYAVGDHVYRARGSNTPRPRPGDIGILISCSGENPTVLKWANNLISSGTFLVVVVGRENSRLSNTVDKKIIIDSDEIKPGVPRDFYMYSSFILSPLPIKLIERFREEGLVLPESILRYYHSTVE